MNLSATARRSSSPRTQPPSATAIDDDVYLTVTTAMPAFPGKVETIDIILSLDYARHVVAQLSRAVAQAENGDAH